MELIIAVVVGILIGGVVGGAACWLVQGSRAKSRQSRMEADHREERAALQGRLEQTDNAEKILEMAKEQLKESFQATASQALQANNTQFMDLAQENPGQDAGGRQGRFQAAARTVRSAGQATYAEL